MGLKLFPVYSDRFERDGLTRFLNWAVLAVGFFCALSAVLLLLGVTGRELYIEHGQVRHITPSLEQRLPETYLLAGFSVYFLAWGGSLFFRARWVWWWTFLNLAVAVALFLTALILMLVLPYVLLWSGSVHGSFYIVWDWIGLLVVGMVGCAVYLLTLWWWRRRRMYGLGAERSGA
ncbi:MAG: hypothetical protein AAGK14_04040 [Verrucomicrobiota bacterium]